MTEKGLLKNSPMVQVSGARTAEGHEIKNLSKVYDELNDLVFRVYTKKEYGTGYERIKMKDEANKKINEVIQIIK